MTHRIRSLAFLLAVCSPAMAAAQVGAGGGGRGSGTGPPPIVLPPSAPSAPPATGAGAISGVVIDGATKTPLADATVFLASDGRGAGSQSRQMTDAKGRFVFTNLPPGSKYTVIATRFGYLDGGYVRDRLPGGSTGLTALRDGEWLSDLRVTMWRPGAIGGTVVDERGEPVAGVLVRTLSRIRIQGRDELAAGLLTTTDDRGMYRIAGLPPGRYLVQVPSVQASQSVSGSPAGAASQALTSTPNLDLDPSARLLLRTFPTPPPAVDGHLFSYPPTFYPGTATVSDAGAIDLRFGEDRSGVDITLQAMPAARISGTVEGPPEALTGLTLRLLPEGLDGLGHGSEAATAMVGPDGRFTFLNVAAGRYTIDAPRTLSEFAMASPGGGTSASSFSLGFASTGFPAPPGTGGWGSTSRNLDTAPTGTSYSTKDFRSGPTSYWGRATIAVSGHDETGVVVSMRPLAIMSGKITVDLDPSRTAPTAPPRSFLHLEPAAGQPGLGLPRVEPLGQGQSPSLDFRIQGLQAGSYVLRAGGEWVVKSIMWKGRDYTDRAFDAAADQDLSGVEVTVTNGGPGVSGKAHDAQGAAAEGATVWLFPVDAAARSNYGFSPQRLKSAGVDHDGSFRIASLAAGDYFAIAVSDANALSLDEDALKAAERSATRVTLAWGETKSLDLTLSTIR